MRLLWWLLDAIVRVVEWPVVFVLRRRTRRAELRAERFKQEKQILQRMADEVERPVDRDPDAT